VRQEPNFDKRAHDSAALDLYSEARGSKLSRPQGSPKLPRPIAALLVILGIFAAWIGWAYFSADFFLKALAQGDRQTIEDYVDRPSYQRSLEVLAPQAAQRTDHLDAIFVNIITEILRRGIIKNLQTYDLVEASIPPNSRIRMLFPTAPTRMIVTAVNERREGVQFVLAFRDFGWYVVGVRY